MDFRLFRPATEIESEPFPHRDVRGAVDPAVYRELEESFPLDQFPDLSGLDHQVLRLDARRLIGDSRTSEAWRGLMSYLVSNGFWRDLVAAFGDEIRSRYPHLERNAGKRLDDWTVSHRGEPAGDIVLEAFVVVNSPALKEPSRVKGVHIDVARKLWTGLLYMRAADDDTPGGELQLHAHKGKLLFDSHQVPRAKTSVSKTVGYESNHFVGFVNSVDAVHSISARSPSRHVRRYVDLVAELPRGAVFKAPQMNILSRAAYRLTGQRERTREMLKEGGY